MRILGYRNVYPRVSVGLGSQSVEALSNLPQQTSSSLLYTLRAPPRYWIATATDMVEPRGPDSSQHVEIEDGFRGRPGSVDIDESRKETLRAGSAQILDSYRNGQRRASEARFGSACRNRRRLPWALWHWRHRRVQDVKG